AATSIDIYMSLIVPALLQTADYARAVITAARPDLPAAELDPRAELRAPPQAARPAGRHGAAAPGRRAGGHGRPATAAAGGRGPAGRHPPGAAHRGRR